MSFRSIICLCLLIACAPAIAVAQGDADLGQHDMVLMLPSGPVHLRVLITVDGQSLKQTREEYLERLIAALDTDKDGKVSRDETTNHPLFTTSRRFQGNEFLSTLRSKRPLTSRELALTVDRAAGQLVAYRQNNALAEQDLSVFSILDEDASGLIERDEMVLAASHIAARDSDFDQCITFDEFLDQPENTMNNVVINTLSQEPPGSVHAELLRSAREPILPARLVRRYDEDRDAHLTGEELGWRKQRVEQLDQDGDGRLSMQELKSVPDARPDMTLQVELGNDEGGVMQLVNHREESEVTDRDDLLQIRRDGMNLAVGYRFRDPMAEAVENASGVFNAIDVDANGYLDRDEIAEHQRFQRYLFDAMDRDGDDRVFADEMMKYVREYTEPASTSCQVTLLDTGNGFFQMLDGNVDGRISIRELRDCENALIRAAGKEEVVNPSRMTASYRIEIKRGGMSLFGKVDRPTAESPSSLIAPPTGPQWFQGMDRNSDGDLTWDEFLGPLEVFHQMDQDHDDLIDKSEASQFEDLAP